MKPTVVTNDEIGTEINVFFQQNSLAFPNGWQMERQG